MQHESKHDHIIDHYTERLVVLQALGKKRGVPLTQVRAELGDIDQVYVEEAIASLQAAGVVVLELDRLYLSGAAQRLDDLTMICI
jgi:hypothetical protein